MNSHGNHEKRKRILNLERLSPGILEFPCAAQSQRGNQGAADMKSSAGNPAERDDLQTAFLRKRGKVDIIINQVFQNGKGQPPEKSGKEKLFRLPHQPRTLLQQPEHSALLQHLLQKRGEHHKGEITERSNGSGIYKTARHRKQGSGKSGGE